MKNARIFGRGLKLIFGFQKRGVGGPCPARTLLCAQCRRTLFTAFRYAASGQSWVDPPSDLAPPPSAHWLLGRPDRLEREPHPRSRQLWSASIVNLLTWSSLLSQAGVLSLVSFEKPDGASARSRSEVLRLCKKSV